MASTDTVSESVFIDSIRPRLHPKLRPLLDESGRCLPILQSTCQQILSQMGTQANSANLAQVISRDHGLTCKVLQVANSIAYSPQQTIVAVPHAVSWLGLDTVRSLVAAAHLVEQLQHWPIRQREFQTLIAKSLLAATYACELGMAIDYPQAGQLFTGALLYSIGDLAIAYQDPDLFSAVQRHSRKAMQPAERLLHETRLIGVPRLTLAQALAQMWKLPNDLVGLFSSSGELPKGRWQGEAQIYRGIVAGSIRLVDAVTSHASQAVIEDAKRTLLVGSGLSSGPFSDLMMRAMDRGRQLIRSMGLTLDTSDDTIATAETISQPLHAKPVVSQEQQASLPRVAPVHDELAAPIRTKPLETLQAFQDSLQSAKDINGLLVTFATSLRQDAGFTRVGLALLNPIDSDLLVGKLVLGVTPPTPYLQSLSGSLSREHMFFLTVLKRVDPLLIPNVAGEIGGTANRQFIETWRPTSAIIAPFRVGAKPIGLIFCDRGQDPHPVNSQDYQAFLLFFAQMTLSLNRLAGIL